MARTIMLSRSTRLYCAGTDEVDMKPVSQTLVLQTDSLSGKYSIVYDDVRGGKGALNDFIVFN